MTYHRKVNLCGYPHKLTRPIASKQPRSSNSATCTTVASWAWCLIGLPGLQKRLARYAQLYSRVGFVHQFQPLSGKELQGVIEQQWVQLGLDYMTDDDQPVDTAVLNAIARVTGGNFRLVQRLFAQIERLVTINNLPAVTTEVVSLARERLVEGAS